MDKRRPATQTRTFVITALAVFMFALDRLVVATALPAIGRDLHAGMGALEWTVNAYTLSFAVLLLTGSALAERFGRRRTFIAGLGLANGSTSSADAFLAGARSAFIAAQLQRASDPFPRPTDRLTKPQTGAPMTRNIHIPRSLRRLLLALTAALALLTALPALSQAATFCVNARNCPQGGKNENGDLQQALNDALATPGTDTVLVGDKGSPYLGPFQYTARGPVEPVEIRADGPGRPVLTAAPGKTVLLAAAAAISGIEVQLPSAATGEGIAALDGTQLRDVIVQGPGGATGANGITVLGAVTITASQVSGTGASGITGGSNLAGLTPTSIDIVGSQASDVNLGVANGGARVHIDGSRISATGAAVETSSNTSVTRSVLETTGATGLGVEATGGVLSLDHTSVVRRAPGSGSDTALSLGTADTSGQANISSTVLAGYTHGIVRDTSQTGDTYPISVRDSVWDHQQDNVGTAASGPFTESGDANVVPAIVDLTHGDFRPRGSSAAIDRDSQTDLRYTDINGVAVVDGDGNGSLRADAGAFEYRRQAPTIASATVPPAATTGDQLTFTSTAADPDGDNVATEWSFGDGSSAAGATATHTYGAGGTFSVTLTATDEVGLTATRTFTIAVAGRAVGGTGGTGTGGTGTGPTNHPAPPRLTGLRVSPNPVKLAQIGRLRLRFSLNERASLTVVAQRPGAHSAKQRTTVRTLARAGRGSITIGGTLKRRHVLTAGTWTLTVVATDAAGNRTKAQTLRLVVRV